MASSAAAMKKKASAKKVRAAKTATDLPATFSALKGVLAPYERKCTVKADKPKDYHLYTQKKIYRGQQVYFAGIKLNKNYVSFYLMTVYSAPKEQRRYRRR